MPVYPGIISSNPLNTIGATSTPGAFQVGGALYVVLNNTGFSLTTWSLQMFKSLDQGQTWAQVGGDSSAVEQNSLFCAVLVGTKIYVVSIPHGAGATRVIHIWPFDTATDTWGVAISTGNNYAIGGLADKYMAAAYRAVDNKIVICNMASNVSPTKVLYFLYDVASQTSSVPVACGTVASILNWDCAAVLPGTGLTYFFFVTNDGGANITLQIQSLSNANALGVVTQLDAGVGGSSELDWTSDGTTLAVGWSLDNSVHNPLIKTFKGPANAEPFVSTEVDYNYTQGVGPFAGFLDNPSISIARAGGKNYLFLDGSVAVGNPDGYVSDSGAGYGAFTTINNPGTYSQPVAGTPTFSVWSLIQFDFNAGTALYFALIPPPPPPPVVVPKPVQGGGSYFPRFVNKTLLHAQVARIVGPVNQINAYREFAPLSWLADYPNDNDVCLSREWRLYNRIDRTALSCARKPDCFSGEEGARPWVEPPPGAVTFNPDKAIPLPAPAAVDVVVMSFRVPIGYDGIILAQYHAYRGQGTFVEASGDIIWRVRVNGRYLRDMGNMQLSIGSPQTLSPCPGGLWVLSGNLVEYVVSAPNGSGSLPLPGQGFILAGLHGWFFPRI